MKYAKLLQLAGKKEQAPSLAPLKWSRVEKERMDQGLCVGCGLQPAGQTSYLCPVCESRDTMAGIQAEINAVKQQIFKK
ncbi:MAG: hypothetical protein C0403_02985 [Desulfobacterium sp.]|nr:hypothetical protein [Desulfobacterium sp.]